ncbi:hypothetical protein D9M68_654760 [compost metagenome]
MQTAAQLLADGTDLVQLGTALGGDVQTAVASLAGADLGNIGTTVDSAADLLVQARGRMQQAAPRLAGLAASIITRRA